MGTFIFVLSVLIVFHELGHYLAARYFGVTVESFSIGFGPRLVGFRRNGTDFKVCLLPFGGYVKMAGMGGDLGEPSEDPGALSAKPRWQRLIIVAMGPVFNFILAIALLAGLYMYRYERAEFLDEEARIAHVEAGSAAEGAGLAAGDIVRSVDAVPVPTWTELRVETTVKAGQAVDIVFERRGETLRAALDLPADPQRRGLVEPGWVESQRVLVAKVLPGSPAEAAGLQDGDYIAAVDGEEAVAVQQVIELVGRAGGRPVSFDLRRGGDRIAVQAVPRREAEGDPWRVGVQLAPRHDFTNAPLPFAQAMSQSLSENILFSGVIFRTLQSLVVGQVPLDSLEGPVGIYEHTKQAAAHGIGPLIQLMALISINLGILNLVPVPVLDGGQILLLLVESLLRRDVSAAVKMRITQAGLAFILILFGIVMYNDLVRKFFPP